MSRIVLATGNVGKLREVKALLADLPCEVVALSEISDATLPEEGDDYAENAAAKALAALAATGLPSLGDDSGIEVVALGGRPGPHSARYGGVGLDSAGRNALLLTELAAVPAGRRGARFFCVAALALPGGGLKSASGECPGEILTAPAGAGGFGYDPIFRPEGFAKAMAEVAEAEKNRLSHRGRAFAALRDSIVTAIA